MKFRRGWIYKYNDWIDDKPFSFAGVNSSKSLCPYFWKTLYNLLVPFMWIGSWYITLGLLGVAAFHQYFPQGINDFLMITLGAITGTVALILILVLIVSCMLFFTSIKNRISNKGIDNFKNKPDNIVIAWVKAKKEKICPMIEWEDEE